MLFLFQVILGLDERLFISRYELKQFTNNSKHTCTRLYFSEPDNRVYSMYKIDLLSYINWFHYEVYTKKVKRLETAILSAETLFNKLKLPSRKSRHSLKILCKKIDKIKDILKILKEYDESLWSLTDEINLLFNNDDECDILVVLRNLFFGFYYRFIGFYNKNRKNIFRTENYLEIERLDDEFLELFWALKIDNFVKFIS